MSRAKITNGMVQLTGYVNVEEQWMGVSIKKVFTGEEFLNKIAARVERDGRRFELKPKPNNKRAFALFVQPVPRHLRTQP